MLLRIFLILAILAGLGTILLTQLQLRPQIQTIIEERETNHRHWKTQEARANKLQGELKDTQTRLAKTTKDLEDTQSELTGTKSRLASETGRANGLQKKLDTETKRANDAEANLAAWNALGIPVEGVKGLIASEKKLRMDVAALEEAQKVLAKKLKDAEGIIAEVFGPDGPPPPVAKSVRGKVLAVDPKFDFVVLDIGDNEGLKPRALLLVSRNSKLVAKVQVTSVQGERSIANIMPGWKLGEVFEGDLVLP